MKIVMALLAAFALLTGGMGISYAAEEPEPTQDCLAKKSRLVDLQAQLEAALGNTVIGVKTVQDAIDTLPGLEPGSEEALDLQNIITLGTQVNVTQGLVDEACATEEPPVTEVPIENPVETDPPFESCQEALDAGVTLPILKGNENYSENLDSDGDGVACELGDGDGTGGSTDEPTPADPATDNNDSDNDVINPTQFDDIPNTSRGVDTGGL